MSEPDQQPTPPCRHCPDGHGSPDRTPWGVRVDTLVDGDGQPVQLIVLPTAGAHVGQADADWLWELIRNRHQAAEDLREARFWARHGYELGQRSLSWTDDGIAPAWLTEGWPTHFPSDLVPRASARSYFAVCPSSGVQVTMTLGGDPGDDLSHLPPVLTAVSGLASGCLCGQSHDMVEISAAAAAALRDDDADPPVYRVVSAADVTWQWGCLLDADVAVTPVSEAAAWARATATGTPVVRRIVGPWEGAPDVAPPPVLPVLHLTASCEPAGGIDVHTTVAVPDGTPVPAPGTAVTLPCSWDGRHTHAYTVDLLEAGRD